MKKSSVGARQSGQYFTIQQHRPASSPSRCISLLPVPTLSAASSSLGKRGEEEGRDTGGRKGEKKRTKGWWRNGSRSTNMSHHLNRTQISKEPNNSLTIKGNFYSCRHLNLHMETKDKARVVTFYARGSRVKIRRNIDFCREIPEFPDRRDSTLRRSLVYVTAFIALTPAVVPCVEYLLEFYDKIRIALSWCSRFYRCQYYIA